jgi:FixJ family two-component response regulator
MTLGVVDDDDDVRTALARLLRSFGHEVRLFPSAETFEAAPVAIDCLIVDVRLPGISGLELLERIQASGRSLPAVLITGDGDPRSRDLPHLQHARCLAKPFDDDALMTAVADAIASGSASASHG